MSSYVQYWLKFVLNLPGEDDDSRLFQPVRRGTTSNGLNGEAVLTEAFRGETVRGEAQPPLLRSRGSSEDSPVFVRGNGDLLEARLSPVRAQRLSPPGSLEADLPADRFSVNRGHREAMRTVAASGHGDVVRTVAASGHGDVVWTAAGAGHGDVVRTMTVSGHGEAVRTAAATGHGEAVRTGAATGHGEAVRTVAATGHGDVVRTAATAGQKSILDFLGIFDTRRFFYIPSERTEQEEEEEGILESLAKWINKKG
jgi:hypothetical protein